MITSTDLQIIFIVCYDNNPAAYNKAFKDAGYNVPDNEGKAKQYVSKKMYSLYLSDPEKLGSIMSKAEWDYNNSNYTNSPETFNKVHSYLANGISSPAGKISWGNIWSSVQSTLLGNQQTIVDQTQIIPIANTANTIGLAIVFTGLGIGVIILVIVTIKMLSKK